MLEKRLSRQQLFTLLVKHLQRPTPHHEINVCSQSITFFFTTELINEFVSLYIYFSFTFTISFLSVLQLILTCIIDYYYYFQLIYVLIQGLFITSSHQIMTNGIFINTEDYIFFTSILLVCCRKLMNLVHRQIN